MKKTNYHFRKSAGILAAGLALGVTHVTAQSNDVLLDKLVEKGVLTVKEANELREESDKGFAKAYSAKSGMPEWVQSFKINGDLRLRYDQITGDNGDDGTSIPQRERYRYRARIGAVATMADHLEAGIRIGSGDTGNINGQGSPFSGNSTFNNDSSRKPVFLDLAYMRYTPFSWMELQAGKMQDLFWATPMIFSPDYNPEGAQEKFTAPINDTHSINFTSGQWVICENSSAADTFVMVDQIDWTAKWHKKFSTRLGVGSYNFIAQDAMANNTVESFVSSYQNGTPSTGTYVAANGLTYGAQDFNPIFARSEATYNLDSMPLYNGEFPITVSYEYAVNPSADGMMPDGTHQPYDGRQNEAYSIGITFGSSKNKGNWQIGYAYKNIETASLWRGFMDDNFGFASKGGTDVRGHQITASYRVLTPLTVGLTYFKTEEINNGPTKLGQQDRLFLDLILAF